MRHLLGDAVGAAILFALLIAAMWTTPDNPPQVQPVRLEAPLR